MSAYSLDAHRERVAELLPTMPALDIALADAHGGMLATDIVADRNLPPHDTAAVDGYAVLAKDASGARKNKPVVLPVTHDADFDLRGSRAHLPGTAVRVPSGAPMPRGADAVVPAAQTDGGVARVSILVAPAAGSGVRREGFDARTGSTILTAGTRLGARHLAMAAALGLPRLPVHPVPRVVIMAVGDELAEAGAPARGGSVVDSTGVLLAGLVREAGAHAYRVGLVGDDRAALRGALEDQLVRADVILIAGGLSGARRDTVGEVVAAMGVFDVTTFPLIPGGHHGLGTLSAGERTVPVIGVPGRPIAAAVAFDSYIRDALRAMSGHSTAARDTVPATATASWSSPAGVVQAVPVMIERGGSVGATVAPVGDPASPTLADLAAANGMVLVPPDATEIREGTILRCVVWPS